jgi:hypothetical protein
MAYLKFDLRAVTQPIVRATLSLHCTNPSADGGTVYPVLDSGWVEGDRPGTGTASAGGAGLTWNDVDTSGDGEIDARDASRWVPELDRPTGALVCVDGARAETDVTAALGGAGSIRSLALRNDSSDGAGYASGESGTASERPRLVLELGGGTPPSPGAVATVDADVTVRDDEPTSNFGTSPVLEVDAAPVERTFLRIAVRGVGSRSIRSVRLLVPVADVYGAPSDAGGRIRPVGCGWDERTLTWSTQPSLGAPVLDTVGSVDRGDTAEFDLTPAVPGDGAWCFALDTLSDNGVVYDAREGASGGPRVVLDVAP